MDQQNSSQSDSILANQNRRAASFATLLAIATFFIYSIWAMAQADHYYFLGGGANYLSPLFSPELVGDSPQGLFGGRGVWMPAWMPGSPALIFLWLIALAAARRAIKECDCIFLLLAERLFAFIGVVYFAFLIRTLLNSAWFLSNTGVDIFGIRGGTVLLAASGFSVLVCLTALFSGPSGRFRRLSRNRSRVTAITLLILAATDLYIRLCSMGRLFDPRIF
ncbi:MAG TPA: hypothetical protein PLR83_02655 [Pyrinomonadaceae bacterium]|nr:hypothetical protein [Pyrinomonadaceae bacterium]